MNNIMFIFRAGFILDIQYWAHLKLFDVIDVL